MERYTVILIAPKSLRKDFGADLFIEEVETDDLPDAVKHVQQSAFDAQDPGLAQDPAEFKVVLVARGTLDIVADSTSFTP